MSVEPLKVLFVCLGNICRSPLAENIFRHLVEQAGLRDRIEIDSAGTSAYHIGEPPDARTTAVARRRGIVMKGTARQITERDLEEFDFVFAMDRENLANVRRLAKSGIVRAKIRLLREFDPQANGELDVPDPYYGGPRGFEDVHDMVERACASLLQHLRTQNGW